MINRRNIFNVLVIAALFVLPAIARSYDLIDLAKEQDIEFTDEETGQCSSVNIGNIVNKFNSLNAAELKSRFKQEFVDAVKTYWPQLLEAIAGSILFEGGGISGARAAVSQIGDKAQVELQAQLEKKYKSELITDCTAQSDIRAILNASRRIIAENGRDGGPVYVRDWRAFQADNRYRGLQIARNEMANTNHCSWVSPQLQGLFNFNPTNAAPPMSGNEDGQDSYATDAACSLPDSFNPAGQQYQTADAFAAMMQPQNNIWGSYLLAQEEIDRQIADEELAGQNEFAYSGGVGSLREKNPATGNSCAVPAPDGSTCLKYSIIVQPAAGVVAQINAGTQAQFDIITNPRTTDKVAKDLRGSLIGSFLSITQPLGKLQYKQSRPGDGTPSPSPSPTNVPGSGDDGDPVCTGGNPDCHCLINDDSQQELARGVVLTATRTAISEHPEMVTPDGVSVLPGQNVPFLQAVCESDALPSIGGCRPNNAGFGLVIGLNPLELNVDVILPNNVIRKPGVVTLMCTSPGNL